MALPASISKRLGTHFKRSETWTRAPRQPRCVSPGFAVKAMGQGRVKVWHNFGSAPFTGDQYVEIPYWLKKYAAVLNTAYTVENHLTHLVIRDKDT